MRAIRQVNGRDEIGEERKKKVGPVSEALQTLAPAKQAYCTTRTMGRRQTHEVLISKITMCQSHKNIMEERRNPFHWWFSLARWGFLRGRPSEPVRAPWKWIFGTFVKVSEFLQCKHTQHTEDCVSGASCWFGLVLQRSSTLTATEGQRALPTRQHYTWPLCQLTIRGRKSSALREAVLQLDPGGGTVTPQCLHCVPFSPPASGTAGKPKKNCCPVA